jgi:nucleotide-binding universal stress UspA family protein
MSENFKLLIAYDGSSHADAALDDLKKAGLPERAEALIFSVAEVWLPTEEAGEEQEYITEGLREKHEEHLKILAEAEASARSAAEKLKRMFAGWTISSEATYGSPAWEILVKAEDFKPDLIVVGACGESAIDRVLLGSVSQKIVTEARASVRVARGKIEVDSSPERLIVGYDGTKGADEVVRIVGERNWSEDAQAKVIIVEDTAFIRRSFSIEEEKIEEIGNRTVEKLWVKGLHVSLEVREGNPKEILVDEAESWRADTIFVGATKFNDFLSKYLLGSVSSAVVTRAHCSVEVVRVKSY